MFPISQNVLVMLFCKPSICNLKICSIVCQSRQSLSASLYRCFLSCISHSMFAACTCYVLFVSSCVTPQNDVCSQNRNGPSEQPIRLSTALPMPVSVNASRVLQSSFPRQEDLSRAHLGSRSSIGFIAAQSLSIGAFRNRLNPISVAARNEGKLRASPLDRGQPLKSLNHSPLSFVRSLTDP